MTKICSVVSCVQALLESAFVLASSFGDSVQSAGLVLTFVVEVLPLC